MPHQILVKEMVYDLKQTTLSNQDMLVYFYKQWFGGFICAMINLTNNKQNKWLSSGSAGTCHSVHTW